MQGCCDLAPNKLYFWHRDRLARKKVSSVFIFGKKNKELVY